MTALTILTYHSLDTSGSVVSVRPEVFAEQMSTLARLGYTGIALRDAIAQRAATGAWPSSSVVITFDDGFANFHEAALPVLTRHGFGATLFLVTGHVGKLNDWAPAPAPLGSRPMLSWKQVSDIAACGVEIGAHTRTHPDLRALSREAAEDEIRAARQDVERELGLAVESFAYPFGYVDDRTADLVRREYRSAVTTTLKRAGDGDLHALPRIDAYYIDASTTLARLVEGKLDAYIALRRIGRSVRALLPL